ncbi:MAG: hypothetical protein ACI89L_002684 [Phycisphaerales bacterium]|jgi:hypothetical protein
MPRYLIEREIPGCGAMSEDELHGAATGSCKVINEIGPDIAWVHSYVTEDKIYCVYDAKSEDEIKTHAEKSGFPANSIQEIKTVIDPSWSR